MGFRHLRDLDLPRMLRQTSQPRSPPLFRQVGDDGQVEGCRAGQDESRRKPKGQALFRVLRRLGLRRAHHRQVQLARRRAVQGQGWFCPTDL